MKQETAIKLSNALFEAGLMTTYINPSGSTDGYSVAIYSNALVTGDERITILDEYSITQYRASLVSDIDKANPLAVIGIMG